MTQAPFIAGSETSRAAARSLPDLNRMEQAVYSFIKGKGMGGVTDEDIADYFTAPPFSWAEPTARARRVALMHRGLVVDSGLRRRTRHGRWAIVWVAT